MDAEPPPWDVEGLPCGLTAAHFDTAADVLLADKGFSLGLHHLEPMRGHTMAYFRLSGAHYHTSVLEQLRSSERLSVIAGNETVFPAILVPDPSPGASRGHPIGACTALGYVGSAWNDSVTHHATAIKRGVAEGRFRVSRLTIERTDYGHEVKVRLPSRRRGYS